MNIKMKSNSAMKTNEIRRINIKIEMKTRIRIQ